MVENSKKLSRKSSKAEISTFLNEVAVTPARKPSRNRSRLIFAMDATASREPTWDQACHIQGQMFEETVALGGLNIQLCYYRGYGEFSVSPWLSRSSELLQRMTSVYCLAGYTQIEKVLRHTLSETKRQKVNALVFVGDCMEENISQLSRIAGELGIHGVPAFIFHEGYELAAEQAFQQIAQLTQGAYCRFNASSAQQLKDLLSAVAVYAAGGLQALDKFSHQKGGVVKQLIHQMDRSS